MPAKRTNKTKGSKNKPKPQNDDINKEENKEENNNNNNNNNTDNDNNDNQSNTVKHKVEIDPVYDVPICYVKFFAKKPVKDPIKDINSEKNEEEQPSSIILTIKEEIKRGKKTATVCEWKPNNNPFDKKKLEQICEDLKKKFATTCTIESNSLVLFGSFAKPMKEYLIENHQFAPDQIVIKPKKLVIPPFFTVLIKEGEDAVKIQWVPRGWTDQTYQQFVDNFELNVTEWNLEQTFHQDRKSKVVYAFNGPNLSNKFSNYFKETLGMKGTGQVEVIPMKSGRERPISEELTSKYSNHPYEEMIQRFGGLNDNSYEKKMCDTIRDSYEFEQERLANYEINAQLTFTKSGSDKNGHNYWITSFSAIRKISIDGIQTGRLISEGDEVIVKFRNRRRTICGSIIEIEKGTVKAIFRIPFGKYPPGMSPQGADGGKSDEEEEDGDENAAKINDYDEGSEVKEEESENEDDEDDTNPLFEEEDKKDEEEENNENDYDIQEEEEEEIPEDDNSDKPYSITFKRNMTTYQRSALALMHLHDLKSSPIKSIITDDIGFTNKSQNNELKNINDASFDLTDSPFITDIDRQSKVFMSRMKFDATPSQTKAVNMIIQNNIAIVHGPPGCGKTSSISLFVYHLLKQASNDKKRILLCAYSNQAVENIAKFVSPIVRALGKKMVWIPKKSMTFENRKEFLDATEEQKSLSFYKILTRETVEAKKYQKLQEKKWELDLRLKNFLKAKKERKRYFGKELEIFPAADQRKMDDIRAQIEKTLISEADVVCCTLITSAKKNMESFRFEYVFVDEASQAEQMVSLIPIIHHPSKIVLLGDHKQLDANTPLEMSRKHPDTTVSLYLKLLKKKIQHVMLNVQFRMNPLIAKFPNEHFYKGKIKNAEGMDAKTRIQIESIKTPIVFVDVNGKEKKTYGLTYKNIKEAIVVERILNNLQKNKISGSEIGVITPYSAQSQLIRNQAFRLKYQGLRVSCVDNFQGSERDIIILSLVRTNKEGKFGFLPNKRRINVSLTRARKALIIVGNFNAIKASNSAGQNPQNEFLVDLCNFYEQNNAVINEKEITRITILVTKPEKATTKLDIKMGPKFNPKPLNSEEPKKKDDEFEYDDDDDDDNEKVEPLKDDNLDKINDFGNKVDDADEGNDEEDDDFSFDSDSEFDNNEIDEDKFYTQ